MAQDRGFFYVQHGFLDHPIFKGEPFTEREAFLWLIDNAAYKNHTKRWRGRTINVMRGQVSESLRNLAEKWKWSVNRVNRYIKVLENERMIATRTDTGFLIVTICNYAKFQGKLTKTDTLTDTLADTLVNTETNTLTDTLADTTIKKGKEREVSIDSEVNKFTSAPTKNSPPSKVDLKKMVFDVGLELLGGDTASNRGLLGRWVKQNGDGKVLQVILDVQSRGVADPKTYLSKALQTKEEAEKIDKNNRNAELNKKINEEYERFKNEVYVAASHLNYFSQLHEIQEPVLYAFVQRYHTTIEQAIPIGKRLDEARKFILENYNAKDYEHIRHSA